MEIEPGDAIFYPVTPRSDWASKFVAVFEILLNMGRGTEMYSHVAVVDDDVKYQREAYWPRTRRSRIDPKRPREIWRLCKEDEEKKKIGLRWCQAHMGEWYNMAGLLFGWLRIHFHQRYCSEFLRSCKQAEGFKMPHDQRGYFSPNQAMDYYKHHGFMVASIKE